MKKKPYPDGIWYTVETCIRKRWDDGGDQFDTIKEARKALRDIILFPPDKAAIIKHTTTATIVEQKP